MRDRGSSRLRILSVLPASQAVSQQAKRISGRVLNSSGAAVPPVRFTSAADDTKVPRAGVSGADGFYEFADVAPGRYTLEAEASGESIAPRGHCSYDGRFGGPFPGDSLKFLF